MAGKVVLVTGASGGFGRVLVRTLAEAGMRVYGTARAPSEADAPAGVAMLPLDVGEPGSIARCIDDVVAKEGRIDVLVNCVNQMIIGRVEEQTLDEVRALYETNVFGVMALCKAILPVMRAQGGGTIVNMSSLGGLLAVPTMSAYTSAKFALEAFSEALYHEVQHEHIDVVIMQPVAMKMDRPATGAHLDTVAGVEPGSTSLAMVEQMARDTEASHLRPEDVAARVLAVIQQDSKPLRVPMDRARVLTWVRALAPQAAIDKLMGNLLGKVRPPAP